MNTGHTHTPSIYGGVYTAGVAGSLDMGYNVGASSWTQTHLITYANGQRTLIDFKNGKFVYYWLSKQFAENGYTKVFASSESKKYNQYLLKLGFTEAPNGRFIKILQ